MSHRKRLLLFLIPAFFWLEGLAQDSLITGRVAAADGNLISGVSVSLKGSSTGTVTDAEGRFSISASRSQILVFSYVGYKTREVTIRNATHNLEVQLETADNNLNSVVVIGYGSQKKSDVTGAISSLSQKTLKEVPVTSPAQMLQGRAAGVDVLNAGNKPGDGVTVRVRGRRSFNAGNDPLYVIDGVPITEGLNDINPGDIESIEILKDASATAIYGSRGANGVIIITTKRGRMGRTNVSYNGYYGLSTIARYADLMNGEQFAEYKRESRRAVINTATGKPLYDDSDPDADAKLFEPVELQSIKDGTYTDWQRLMVKKGYSQDHELSVNGGSATTKFNIALGYYQDIGIIPGQDYTRYTTRVNVDQSIGKRFKVGMSTLGSYSIRNGQDVNPYGQSSDFGALTENPLGKAYDSTGNLIFLPTSDGLRSNPLSELVPGAVINRGKRFRLLSNVYGEVEILDGLKFKTSFSPDLIENRLGNFWGSLTNTRRNGDPAAASSESLTFNYTWENLLTYKTKIRSKHSLDFTGLYSVQEHNLESSQISVAGLPVEAMEYYNMGAASIINSVGSAYENWDIISYMARINYAFDNRFLLTLTGRADGSSKFADGNRWGYFPSVALGWNILNEKFMSDVSLFSMLKLRASYGKTGNEGIPPYQTNSLLTRSQYDFDGAAAFGYRPASIPNKNLKWENTASFNIGLDFGLFGNRISGSIEYYNATTTNLLLPKLLPVSTGFLSVLTNVGSKRNTGFELTLSTLNIVSQHNGFQWSTDLNLFTNKEQILELSQGKVDDVGNLLFIGQPATVYYDFQKTGIWQLGQDAEAKQYGSIVGGIKVADLNSNGVIDPNDRKILGTDVPKLMGGMTNRFSYKWLDLSVVLFARFGSMIKSPFHGNFRFLSGRVNQYNVNYWTPANPTNDYPRPNVNQESPIYGSTLSYMDGSFVKIRNISLGYNFSERALSQIHVEGLRIYLSVQDPFVFAPYVSKYNGIDPELPTTSTPPVMRFMFGLNVHL